MERVESLAARLRPFIVPSEPIYLRKVVAAIQELVPVLDEDARQELESRASWFEHRIEKKDGVNYSIQPPGPNDTPVTEMLTNPLIAESWMYGDLAHADPHGDKAKAMALDYDDRYRAASSPCCDLAVQVIGLLRQVRRLCGAGVLDIFEEAWCARVTASENGGPSHEATMLSAYVGSAGTPPPADGAPIGSVPGFKRLTFTTIQRLASPESRVQAALVDENEDVLERLPGAYRADEKTLTIFIDDRVNLSLPTQALREADSGNGGKMELSPMGGAEGACVELMKRACRPNAMLVAFDFDGKTRAFKLQLSEC